MTTIGVLRVVAPAVLAVSLSAHTWLHRRVSAYLHYPAGGPIGARNGNHLRSAHYKPEAGRWLAWLSLAWLASIVAFVLTAYAWLWSSPP